MMQAEADHDIDAQRLWAQHAVGDLRARTSNLDDDAIVLILRDARSHFAWTDRPVPIGSPHTK